jgi:hypothetical protein
MIWPARPALAPGGWAKGAVRRNDAHVLAHRENLASVRAAFDEVLSHFVTEPMTDPPRLAFAATM